MDKQSSFAERLRRILEIRQITKADLSRMTGINKSSLTHYERGDWEGKQDAVYKIARALNVSEAWLMGFGESEDVPPPSKREQPTVADELSEKDQRLVEWFRSLPPEMQAAILTLQGGPEDVL